MRTLSSSGTGIASISLNVSLTQSAIIPNCSVSSNISETSWKTLWLSTESSGRILSNFWTFLNFFSNFSNKHGSWSPCHQSCKIAYPWKVRKFLPNLNIENKNQNWKSQHFDFLLKISKFCLFFCWKSQNFDFFPENLKILISSWKSQNLDFCWKSQKLDFLLKISKTWFFVENLKILIFCWKSFWLKFYLERPLENLKIWYIQFGV